MKAGTISIKDLDASCWPIQLFGREHCQTCPWNGTKDCGANFGNAKKIKTGKMEVKTKAIARKK